MRLPSVTAMAGPAVWAPELEVLYRERYDRMVRVAYLVCGDRAAAEEITQDAFVATHQAWSRVREPAAYLRTAVVNRCRSWGRRHQLELTRRVARPRADRARRPTRCGTRCRSLPDRQRAAIVLRFYEDLPDEETAEILGCRPATVRTAIHRALEGAAQGDRTMSDDVKVMLERRARDVTPDPAAWERITERISRGDEVPLASVVALPLRRWPLLVAAAVVVVIAAIARWPRAARRRGRRRHDDPARGRRHDTVMVRRLGGGAGVPVGHGSTPTTRSACTWPTACRRTTTSR